MQEIMVKTHLIIKDIHSEYNIKWCGRIIDAKPAFDKNGLPIFIIIGSKSRMEIGTTNMKFIEKCAKRLTNPTGRSAVCSDSARIYIKEVDGNEKLLAVLTHKKVKTFAPMYDPVWYKKDF